MSSAIVQSAAPEIPPATQDVPSQPHKTPTKPSLRYATPPSPPSSGPSSPPRLDEISHDDPWSDSILPAPLPAQTAELVIELTPIWKDANQGHGGMNASTLEGSWRSHGAQRVPGDEGPSGSERAEVVFDASKREVASIASLGVYDPKRESSSSTSRLVLPVPVAPVRKVHGPMPTAVWADIMDTSKGRDKVLKCAQYSLRTYLYLLSLVAAVRPLSPWFKANQRRLKTAVSGLSLTRKCLLLLNPLHPLTELLSPQPMAASTMLLHLINLMSAMSDDIYCLFKLGIVSKRTGKWADKWANRFWLLTTLMGLYTLHLKTLPSIQRRIVSLRSSSDLTTMIDPVLADEQLEKEAERRADMIERRKWEKELSDAKWTNRKLLADLVFVSYDVFKLTWLAEPVQCAAGLSAALIAANKLYDKHWRACLGK
ncbi:hypothetical protein DB88DRAFT_254725 [Papiliotrema laurentii]|uniref:Uncharacterized protein n=1 Tax=Papiliotrema laurentii TaxID=5418 RepID=A0AAD9FS93_PAPLA|nr:hypothetical protein DB88DRAFT_254725 [Papiliotrema laurentii]